MRALTRNKRAFAFCLLDSANAAVVDENGNRTGEYIPVYKEAVAMCANVSPASGYAETEQFGDLTDYDHVIVTDWLGCPIDESTVLFLDKAPEYRSASVTFIVPLAPLPDTPLDPIDPPDPQQPTREVVDESESNGGTETEDETPETETVQIPLYDYIVRRVSKSINSVSIAVSKVKVR